MGDEELLWGAVSEAVEPIMRFEVQLERDKLEKRIRDYFKKAAKTLTYGNPWDALVNEYADNVFSSLFSGLGDREWLTQCDFLFCVDAGVKDLFPAHVLHRVPQQIFEQTVLRATDRAFDEQRYESFRWETLQRIVTGKNTQKKVREASDAGRQEAVAAYPQNLHDFVTLWISCTVRNLAATVQGDPSNCLEEEKTAELFQALVQEGGLPKALTDKEEAAGIVPALDELVRTAYLEHSMEGGIGVGGGKRSKTMYKGKGKGNFNAFAFGGKVGAKGFASGEPPDVAFAQPPAKRWKGGW